MAETSTEQLAQQTDVAIEYYKGIRQEVIERLKMRDQLLIAYLGGVVALLGFAVKDKTSNDLMKSSMILLPFLAAGAAAAIAQHQDIVAQFAEYNAIVLSRFLPASSRQKVTPYEHTSGSDRNSRRNLWLAFVTQLGMLCGPFVVSAAFNSDVLRKHERDALALFVTGAIVCLAVVGLLWRSKVHRERIFARIYEQRLVMQSEGLILLD